MKIALQIIIVLFTIGWAVPAWLGIDTYFQYLNLTESEQAGYTFPYVTFSESMIKYAVIWMLALAAAWSWVGTRKISKKK